MGHRRKTLLDHREINTHGLDNSAIEFPTEDYNDNEDVTILIKQEGWGCRHTLALLGFLGFLSSYAMRVNLSIALVAMVSTDTPAGHNISTICPVQIVHINDEIYLKDQSRLDEGPEVHSGRGEFNWTQEEQGIILGSFFYGYVLTQVPGGIIAETYGGKWPFGLGMLTTALFSLLTPYAARTGKGALILVRIIQGIGEGFTNPSIHHLLSKWVPPLERSKIGAFVYAGTQFGIVIAMPVCGQLISLNVMGGWPSVFYVFGIVGIVWFVLWTMFVFDTPSSHPMIESKELSYIQHSIGAQVSKRKVPTPWKKIFTSKAVFAILIAQAGHGWGLYTLLTEMPTYMKTVLNFDIKNNSLLSALPYLVMTFVSLLGSWFADYLREQDIAKTVSVRKIFNTIAHWGPAFALLGLAYAGCDRVLSISLLMIAVGLTGAASFSFNINHIDIAPNHAAVLMGLTNGFANLCGIAAPYTAGLILSSLGGLEGWKLIFFISSGIYFLDNLVYLLFADGEEQSWNRDPNDHDEDNQGAHIRDPLLGHSRSAQRFH